MFPDAIDTLIQDYLTTIEFIAVAIGVAVIVLWLWLRARRAPLARPLGWLSDLRGRRERNQSRGALNEKLRQSDPETLVHRSAQATRFQRVYDQLNKPKTRRHLKRRASALESLKAHTHLGDQDFDHTSTLKGMRMAALEEAIKNPVPINSGWFKALLTALLIGGDVLIVSGAIASTENVSQEMTWVLASAIAVTIWASGKVVGEAIVQSDPKKQNRRQVWMVLAFLSCILVAAAGLALLRVQGDEAFGGLTVPAFTAMWIALAVLPGLGSTAVALLSSSPELYALDRLSREVHRKRRQNVLRVALMRRWARRFRSYEEEVRLDLVLAHLDEQSVGAEAGLVGEGGGDPLESLVDAEQLDQNLLGSRLDRDLPSDNHYELARETLTAGPGPTDRAQLATRNGKLPHDEPIDLTDGTPPGSTRSTAVTARDDVE